MGTADRFNHGFSLIEIMVVVAIIGILASILTINGLTYLDEADRRKAQAIMQNLSTGLERYRADYRRYPRTTELVEAMETQDKGGQAYCELSPSDIGDSQSGAKDILIFDRFGVERRITPAMLGSRFVLGPRGYPIVYVPRRDYGGSNPLAAWNDTNGNSQFDLNETLYAPTSFQLWWPGKDGMVRGIVSNESFFPALSPYDDKRDNDSDGLIDLEDNYRTSSSKPLPQNLAEDDVYGK